MGADGLPNTFVPGRNLVFLTLRPRWPTGAASAIRRRHVRDRLFRLSRLPRRHIKALQVALNLGMASRFELDTPLMWLDKAATWRWRRARRRRRWSS